MLPLTSAGLLYGPENILKRSMGQLLSIGGWGGLESIFK
jgi:hypothetical protein